MNEFDIADFFTGLFANQTPIGISSDEHDPCEPQLLKPHPVPPTKEVVPGECPSMASQVVLSLKPNDLPPTPFELGGPHCVVIDRAKFLGRLQADIRIGPTGPRAMYSAIQSDLVELATMLDQDDCRTSEEG